MEKKIQKFLVKRNGGEQKYEKFKKVKNDPKNFMMETNNSSVSSFSELTYYGDKNYLTRVPSRIGLDIEH